jgi:hypothetical protein
MPGECERRMGMAELIVPFTRFEEETKYEAVLVEAEK